MKGQDSDEFERQEKDKRMTDALKLAERQLLTPGGLDQGQLEHVLAKLMGPAVDAGDLYFQSSSHESWLLEDGLVRSGSHSVEQGVGIRAISGEKTHAWATLSVAQRPRSVWRFIVCATARCGPRR